MGKVQAHLPRHLQDLFYTLSWWMAQKLSRDRSSGQSPQAECMTLRWPSPCFLPTPEDTQTKRQDTGKKAQSWLRCSSTANYKDLSFSRVSDGSRGSHNSPSQVNPAHPAFIQCPCRTSPTSPASTPHLTSEIKEVIKEKVREISHIDELFTLIPQKHESEPRNSKNKEK